MQSATSTDATCLRPHVSDRRVGSSPGNKELVPRCTVDRRPNLTPLCRRGPPEHPCGPKTPTADRSLLIAPPWRGARSGLPSGPHG